MNIDMAYVFAGALTGCMLGLTGVGGGALMTPILLLVFNIEPTTAVATDLWFAAITKIAGVGIHHSAGQVDWQVVKRLWSGSIPIALLTVLFVSMGGHIFKILWLTDAIALIVIVTAIGILFAPQLLKIARKRRLNRPEKFKAKQPGLTVVAGAVVGLCVAMTSIGAGAIGSVLLLYLYPLRMTPHRLIATDLMHAIPLALVVGLGYLTAGMVNGGMLFNLLIGSIPAIIMSSFLARKISGRWLQITLAFVLLIVGLKILI